ncbi:hypothetical protein [Chryseobacterium joostei]|uniref:hypothetical protein n=1 Tax=Chryseobacterium joostei TaxID=112234 RepID=UPI003D0BAF3C
MISKLITMVLLIWVLFIKAQENNNLVQQEKITTFLKNTETKNEHTTFLIYNIGKEYLVITQLDLSFNFYWYKEKMDFTKQIKTYNLMRKRLHVKDKLLEKLFKHKCSHVDYINKEEGGSYIYFELYSNNIKECEFIVPYMNYDKEKKTNLPIRKKYLRYLTEKLLNIN